MANARAVIDIDVNTSPAAAGLRSLQAQINGFSSALNKANTEQGLAAKGMARQLSDLVNSSKFFTAETVRMQTSAAQLDSTLKKGQVSMGQFFSAKFRKDGLAAAQVMSLANARASALQTQFIQVGAAAGGMREALAIRPLQAFNNAATVSAQKLAIHRAMMQQATTSMINFGKNTQWAGRQLMVGFTVPLTIFGGLASKTFKELEEQAINFKKVYGDIFTTEAETEEALQSVRDLSMEFTKYGIAVKDSMALAGVAAQSGLRNAELISATTQATRLATLGQMEQAEAMKTIISLQTAFKSSNDEVAESVDFLNIIENQTVLSLQDVAGAIPRVAPVIKGLGGDVKDLAVLLVAMKEGGVSAGEGANALKTSLSRLISPTRAATNMASEFGINLNQIVESNRGEVVPMIKELADAMQSLDGLSQQRLLSEVFGKRQFARMGALFGSITDGASQSARAMELINMSAEDLAATADKELSTMEEATGTKMVAAMERLKVAIAPIGEMFLKMATPIVNFLASIAEKFNNLPDFAKRFVGLATVITGLVIPAGTMFLGLLMNLIGTLTKFGHLVGIAFKGFMSGGFKGAFDSVSQALKYMSLQEIDAANAAQQLAGTTQAVNAALLDQVGNAESSTAAIMGLAGAYDILAQNMRESMLVGGLPMAVPGQAGLRAGRSGLLYKPLPIVARNKGGSIPYMSTGSTVPGTGNKDTVPAMLTPGEFVVNKQATQQNMGLLHAINNGDVQYRNKGGGIAKTGRGYYGVRPNPFALAAQQARSRLEEFESSRSAIAQTFGLPVGGAPRSASAFGAVRTTQVSTARRSRDIFDAVVGRDTRAARMLRAAESLGISKDEMGLKQVGNYILAMSPSSNVRMANGNLSRQRLLAELDNPSAYNPLSAQLRKYFGKSLNDKAFDEIYRQQIAMLPESGITNALFEKASRNALRVYLDRSGFDKASRKSFLRDILAPDSVRGNLTKGRLREALRANGITPNEDGGDIRAVVNGEEFNFGDLTGRTFTRLGRPSGISRYDELSVGRGLARVHANKGGMIPGVQQLRLGGGVIGRMILGAKGRTEAPKAFKPIAQQYQQDNIRDLESILSSTFGEKTWKKMKKTSIGRAMMRGDVAHKFERKTDADQKIWWEKELFGAFGAENRGFEYIFGGRRVNAKKFLKEANSGKLSSYEQKLMNRFMGGVHPTSDSEIKAFLKMTRNLDSYLNKNKGVAEIKNFMDSPAYQAWLPATKAIFKARLKGKLGGTRTIPIARQLPTINANKGGIIPGFARGGAVMSRAAQLRAIKEVQGFGIFGSKVEDRSLRSILRLGFNDTRTDSPSDFVRSMFGRWETTPTRISPKENTTMLLKGKKPKYAPVSQEDYLADMIMSGDRFSDVVDAFKPITIGRMRGTGETRVFDGHTRIHSKIVKGLIERKLGLSTAGMSKEELIEAIKTIRQMSIDGKITNTDVMRSTSGQRVLTRSASDREVDKLFDHPLRRRPMGSMMNREGRTLIAGIHDTEIESIVNAARKANFYGVGKDTESLMKSMGFVSLGGGSRFRYEPGADFRNRSSYINNMGRRITDDLIDRGEILPLRRNKGGIIPQLAGGGPIGLLRSYMAGNFDIMRDAATRRSVMSLATPVSGTFYRGTQIGSGALPKYLERELLQAEKTGDYSKVLGKTFKMRSSDWSTDESTAARFMQMNRAKEKQDFLNYEKNLTTRQLRDAEEYVSRVESGRIGFVNEGLLESSRTKIPMLRKDLERINRELADLGELSPLLIKASGTIKGVEASKLVPDATYLGRSINEDNIISSGGMFQIKSASRGKLEIVPAQQRNTGGEIFESAKKTIVPGVGNKDTVPAALTPGEFVINKQATQANKPLLQAINSGKAIAMNKGGLIPGMQYLNPGGMAQRVAQQSRAMSSKGIYTKSEVEDIFGNIRPTYRLKDQDYMFRGYGEKPGVIGKTSTVKELDATPESLLSEAIVLNPNDPKLKSMLSNFKNKNFGKDEVSLLDDIAAAMAINKQGEFSPQEKTSGLALVLASLSGDEQARTSVGVKKQAFYRKVEEARKKEIERNKAIQVDSEAASLDELAFVHSTRHKIDRGPDGTVTLKPAAHHRLGTEESYPRSSVHFTINSKVEDHVMGSWDAANKLIVTSGRKVIDANNNPAALRSVDTFWEIGPGENMILRNASVVSPHNNQSIYKRELVNRGIANPDGTLPFLVDDAARNDVLYFTKATDEYTNDDRIRILQDLGRSPDEARALATTIQGQENSLLEKEALKRAMQQQKVAAEPETLGQWGYNYNKDLDARIGALAQKRGISGEIHAGTPSAQLEKSALMPMGYDYNRFDGSNINSYRWLIASGHTKTKSTRPKASFSLMDGNTGGMVPGVQYFARNMLQRVVQPLRGPKPITSPQQQKHVERKLATWLGGGMNKVNVRELTKLGLARRHEETELFRGMPIRSLEDGATPRFAPEVHQAFYRYAKTGNPDELAGVIGKPIAIGARSFSKSKKTAQEFAENISKKDTSFIFKMRDEGGIYGIDPYQRVGTSKQSLSYRELRKEYKRKEKEIIPVGSPEKGRPDVVVGRIALDKDGSIVIDTGAKLSRRETVAVTKEYDAMVGARFTPRSEIRDVESQVRRIQSEYSRLKTRKSAVSSKESGDLYAELSRLEATLLNRELKPRTARDRRSLRNLGDSIRSMSDDLTFMFNRAKANGLNKGGFISPTLQMNDGNMVPGMGNKDTVPAMLTPGEFVVNQKASQENLGLLHAINSGKVQGYELGGIVADKDGFYVEGKKNFYGPMTEEQAMRRSEQLTSKSARRPLFKGLRKQKSQSMPGMRGMGASMGLGMGGMGIMMAGQQMQASAAQRGEESQMGSMLSQAGIGLSMASILPFIPKIGMALTGIAVGVGAAVVPLVALRNHIDDLAKSSAEAGSNLGGAANRMEEISAATGYQFASQRMGDRLFRFTPEEVNRAGEFAQYFESDQGKAFIEELQKLSFAERYEKVASIIAQAVADGMDPKTAKAYGDAIAYYTSDALLKSRLYAGFKRGDFDSGTEALIELLEKRQEALQEATQSAALSEIGTSGLTNELSSFTGIGEDDRATSIWAEGVAKAGAGAAAGAIAGGIAGSVVPIVGTAVGAGIGAIGGTIVGGIVGWQQAQEQIQKLNANVRQSATTLGASIQVIKEARNAESALIEARRNGIITEQQFSDQLQRVRQIENQSAQSIKQVVSDIMQSGVVDEGAMKQALKDQFVLAGFEGNLAEAVTNSISFEEISKSLFPGFSAEEIAADPDRAKVVQAVLVETLAGITPENAQQRIADVRGEWARVARELLNAAQEGVTLDPNDVRDIQRRSAGTQQALESMYANAGEIPMSEAEIRQAKQNAIEAGEIGFRRSQEGGRRAIYRDPETGRTFTEQESRDIDLKKITREAGLRSDMETRSVWDRLSEYEQVFGSNFTMTDAENLQLITQESGLALENVIQQGMRDSEEFGKAIRQASSQTLAFLGITRDALNDLYERKDEPILIIDPNEIERAAEEWGKFLENDEELGKMGVDVQELSSAFVTLGETAQKQLTQAGEEGKKLRLNFAVLLRDLPQGIDLSLVTQKIDQALEEPYATVASVKRELAEINDIKFKKFGDNWKEVKAIMESVDPVSFYNLLLGADFADEDQFGEIFENAAAGVDKLRDNFEDEFTKAGRIKISTEVIMALGNDQIDANADAISSKLSSLFPKGLPPIILPILLSIPNIAGGLQFMTAGGGLNLSEEVVDKIGSFDNAEDAIGKTVLPEGDSRLYGGVTITKEMVAAYSGSNILQGADLLSGLFPSGPGGGGAGGGGGGQKSILQQLKEQFGFLKRTYDAMERFINSKTGVFKKIAAGPFGPQFIEFLKSQGEEGLKILEGDLNKFKKVYNEYLNVQMQSARNVMQSMPQAFKSQTMQEVGRRMITDRLGRQGFTEENVEAVMSQFQDPEAVAEAYAVARRRKKKGKDLTDEQQELLEMFSPGNMKKILNQITKFNEESREQFVQTKEEALELENEFRDTLEGRNISPEVIDMLLEMGYTSKDLETNLEAIVGHAQRLDANLAQTKFADSMEGMNREVDQANFALELMGQGVGPEAAAAISQIGLAGQLTNEQIQDFAKTFEDLQILQMAMQDPAQLRLQQLQGQENINQLKYEIELLENINKNETMSALYAEEKVDNHEDLLEVYERENELKSREIELRQRALEPIDEEITKLEEQKTTLEETYQDQFEALDQILEKENEIFATRERMLNVAQALSRGDVAEAATAAIQLERERAEQRRQDQRSALELQRQQEIESIDEKINNAKDRRKVIEEDIKRLQLEQRAIQDQIYNTQFIINEEAARLEDKYKLGNNQLAILRQELALAESEQRKLNAAIDAQNQKLADTNRIRQQNATSYSPAPAPSPAPVPGVTTPGTLQQANIAAGKPVTVADRKAQTWYQTKTPADSVIQSVVNRAAQGQTSGFRAREWAIIANNIGRAATVMYGGKIKQLMFGGSVNYRGSREAPPGMMYGGKMKKYAEGSWVGGTGMLDSVPALLTPGEFVVRRPVAQAYGPLLESLNGKVFPRVNFSKAMPAGSAGDPGSMYNYNVNVTLNGADMNPDEVANAVMKKIKMGENTRVRGYNTRG